MKKALTLVWTFGAADKPFIPLSTLSLHIKKRNYKNRTVSLCGSCSLTHIGRAYTAGSSKMARDRLTSMKK